LYPVLKSQLALTFGQVGLITLTYQIIASLLQPLIGHYTDRRPQPYSLSVGMGFTLMGMLLLSVATSYSLLLIAASCVGVGSAVRWGCCWCSSSRSTSISRAWATTTRFISFTSSDCPCSRRSSTSLRSSARWPPARSSADPWAIASDASS